MAREKFHTECNWWLDGVNEEIEHEQVACKINEATNLSLRKSEPNKVILRLEDPEIGESHDSDDKVFIDTTKVSSPPVKRQSSSYLPPVPPRPISKMISVERQPSHHSDIDDEDEEEEQHDDDGSDSFESDTCEDETDEIEEDLGHLVVPK